MEARDCLIEIDLPDCVEDTHLDDETLTEWITDVCNSVFSAAFSYFSRDQMSLDHTKIFCS